jgi:hypothetical protein
MRPVDHILRFYHSIETTVLLIISHHDYAELSIITHYKRGRFVHLFPVTITGIKKQKILEQEKARFFHWPEKHKMHLYEREI